MDSLESSQAVLCWGQPVPLVATLTLVLVQATVAGNDGDFVIPTLRPLHRGGSRHSILLSSWHEAAQSRDQRSQEQPNKQSGSRKTSFRVVTEDAAHLPEEHMLSLQQQQQHQSKKLSFETQEQVECGQGSDASQSCQDQAPVGEAQEVAKRQGAEAPDSAKMQGGDKQYLGQTQSQTLSGASPAKQTQRRSKPMQPIHDWVGSGSKRQPHK